MLVTAERSVERAPYLATETGSHAYKREEVVHGMICWLPRLAATWRYFTNLDPRGWRENSGIIFLSAFEDGDAAVPQ